MIRGLIGFGLVFVAAALSFADDATKPLLDSIQKGIQDGQVVGAQIVIGDRTRILDEHNLGKRGPGDKTPVDRDTRFCIGSCSKPLASACILKLAADKKLTLDDPIDKWIPAFKNVKRVDGARVTRAPTVRELLAHRGGLFSQKIALSARQAELIRTWKQTLKEAVDVIAVEALIAEPGEKFAYSGAGYCVAGRVAEMAANADFDQLLRETLCKPLGLKRTGYFLDADEINVAIGGHWRDGKIVPHPMTPHLRGKDHRFALVGGSVYSTAREVGSFAKMMLEGGRSGETVVIPPATFNEFIKPQYKDQRYGLGWVLETGPDNEVTRLFHNGALAAYRSLVQIDLKRGRYAVINVTLVDNDDDAEGFLSRLQPIMRETLSRVGSN